MKTLLPIVYMINSLQRVRYQIEVLVFQQRDFDVEWSLTEDDAGSLAERALPVLKQTSDQLLEVLLLEKTSLIDRINQLFLLDSLTSPFSLSCHVDDVSRVLISGGVEEFVSIDFVTCGSHDELKRIVEGSSLRHLFLGSRFFDELAPAKPDMRGEFWCFKGDQLLGHIFWPFLIPLGSTLFSINNPASLIIDLEGSEK